MKEKKFCNQLILFIAEKKWDSKEITLKGISKLL